jgi:Flp pilus assembly protein TadD
MGWAWYLVSLLPVIGLVQAGTQGRADRYTYLPLVGVFVAVAWALPGASEGVARASALRRVAQVAAGAAVLAAALVSHAQAAHWRDTPAVWQRAIAVTDDNALAWGNLGVHHLTSGQPMAAVTALEQAVRIDPRAASHWVDLGAAYRASGRLGEARDAFVRATQLAPRHRDAAFQLGVTLLSAGDPFAAVAALERTVEIDPRHAGAWAALAVANATIGDPSRARAAAEQVRGLAPGLAAEVDAQLAAMGLLR